MTAIEVTSLSLDEKVLTRESRLLAGRLDDPKTKETVNALIKGRQDFVSSVKAKLPEIKKTLEGGEKERAEFEAKNAEKSAQAVIELAADAAEKFALASQEVATVAKEVEVANRAAEVAAEAVKIPDSKKASDEARKAARALEAAREAFNTARKEHELQAKLKEQKEEFQKFCIPGMKYEGYWQYGNQMSPARGMVYVVFEKYTNTDQSEVTGTVTFTLVDQKFERPFSVAVNTKTIDLLPVSGIICNDGVGHLWDDHPEFKNLKKAHDFRNLIRNETHITMRFRDGNMEFFIGDSPRTTKYPLDLSEVIRPQPRGLEGVWRWRRGDDLLGNFQVTFNTGTGLYDMFLKTRGGGAPNIRLIYDVRYDGQTWSFLSDVHNIHDEVAKIVLAKVNANTFERGNERWERVGGAPPQPVVVEGCPRPGCKNGFIPCDNPQCKKGKVRGEKCTVRGCVNGYIDRGRWEKEKCSNCEGGWKYNDCPNCEGNAEIQCPACNQPRRR